MVVHAIWFPMVPGDARDRWPADELVDPRAQHWWDQDRSIGRTLGASPLFEQWAPVVWDVWLLYGATARWHAGVPEPAASGRTIVKTRDTLAAALARLPSRATTSGGGQVIRPFSPAPAGSYRLLRPAPATRLTAATARVRRPHAGAAQACWRPC